VCSWRGAYNRRHAPLCTSLPSMSSLSACKGEWDQPAGGLHINLLVSLVQGQPGDGHSCLHIPCDVTFDLLMPSRSTSSPSPSSSVSALGPSLWGPSR
jgi:hypothetical protein